LISYPKERITNLIHGGPFAEESARIFLDFETMVQFHLPYIRPENIVEIHPAEEAFN
jgi:hypothetical protein